MALLRQAIRCCQVAKSRLAHANTNNARVLQRGLSSPADVEDANQEFDDVFGVAQAQQQVSGQPHAVSVADASGHTPVLPPSHGGRPEPTPPAPSLTHIDVDGRASMVDVSQKAETLRKACASAEVVLGPQAFGLVAANQLVKGDVLAVAQLAGIMGAKHTSLLIPLCHPLSLTKVAVNLHLREHNHSVFIYSTAIASGKTGVEMEALTAASVAALTVYDMCKAVSKGITISHIRLEHKSGGKSGDYSRGSNVE